MQAGVAKADLSGMIPNDVKDLTPFEWTIVESVRSAYRDQYPGHPPDSLTWRKTVKADHRSIFIFFGCGKDVPVFFAKSSSGGATSFRKEFSMLQRLGRNPDFVNSIPHAVQLLEEGDNCAIIENAVVGNMFAPVRPGRIWKRRQVRAHVESVFSWWTQLVTEFPGNFERGRVPRQVELVRQAFIECHGSGEVFSGCAGLLERVAAFGASPPVLSVVHGDLWRENIFCSDRGIVVVDWERTEDAGLPLLDFLLFLSTLIDDRGEEGLVEAFWADTWLSRMVGEYLERACRFLQLSRGEAEDLFYYFLFMMSSQVMRLFGISTEWDRDWLRRLECALRNRASVRSLFRNLP